MTTINFFPSTSGFEVKADTYGGGMYPGQGFLTLKGEGATLSLHSMTPEEMISLATQIEIHGRRLSAEMDEARVQGLIAKAS